MREVKAGNTRYGIGLATLDNDPGVRPACHRYVVGKARGSRSLTICRNSRRPAVTHRLALVKTSSSRAPGVKVQATEFGTSVELRKDLAQRRRWIGAVFNPSTGREGRGANRFLIAIGTRRPSVCVLPLF